jgi:hypothetical protein
MSVLRHLVAGTSLCCRALSGLGCGHVGDKDNWTPRVSFPQWSEHFHDLSCSGLEGAISTFGSCAARSLGTSKLNLKPEPFCGPRESFGTSFPSGWCMCGWCGEPSRHWLCRTMILVWPRQVSASLLPASLPPSSLPPSFHSSTLYPIVFI